MAPAAITKRNESKVWMTLYSDYLKQKYNKFSFKIHDKVRLSKLRTTFKRGYLPVYTVEIFKIADRLSTLPPTYKIIDQNGEILKGSFYKRELVKVNYIDEI